MCADQIITVDPLYSDIRAIFGACCSQRLQRAMVRIRLSFPHPIFLYHPDQVRAIFNN